MPTCRQPPSAQKTSFTTSPRARLLVRRSSSFCMLVKVFISYFFVKDYLPGIEVYVARWFVCWVFLFFCLFPPASSSRLYVPSCTLHKKSAVILPLVPQNESSLLFPLLGFPWASQMQEFTAFVTLGKYLAIVSSRVFSLPTSLSPLLQILQLNIRPLEACPILSDTLFIFKLVFLRVSFPIVSFAASSSLLIVSSTRSSPSLITYALLLISGIGVFISGSLIGVFFFYSFHVSA